MKILAAFALASLQLCAQGAVTWEHDLPSALRRAKAERKLVFMDVWTEWCGWCIKLQKDTFPAFEVQAALAGFVPLSLKTQLKDGTPTEHFGAQAQFQIQGFPALLVLDAEGKEVARRAGYLPPKEFVAWLRSVKAANAQ